MKPLSWRGKKIKKNTRSVNVLRDKNLINTHIFFFTRENQQLREKCEYYEKAHQNYNTCRICVYTLSHHASRITLNRYYNSSRNHQDIYYFHHSGITQPFRTSVLTPDTHVDIDSATLLSFLSIPFSLFVEGFSSLAVLLYFSWVQGCWWSSERDPCSPSLVKDVRISPNE